MTVAAEARPQHERRRDYVATNDQDCFLIPLLRHEIEVALDMFAKPVAAGARVLDVGCGNQPFRVRLEAFGYAYTGMDLEQNESKTVDVMAAIDQPPPPQLTQSGPFELILCTEVLEHVTDWPASFRHLAGLLAPGGRLLVTCPFFWPLHEEPYDFWRPTTHALTHFAGAAGLRPLRVLSAGSIWDVLGTVLGNCEVIQVQQGLVAKVLSWLVDLSRKWALALLRRGPLQRRLELRSLQGPIYLSSIGVFERPAA
jgi:SAM-dependent methyltransferase